MSSPRNGSRARALVLGGGGAVGVGWQTGLLMGLSRVVDTRLFGRPLWSKRTRT
jgi:hypothetical protein